jgi:prepilin signal peptidase PulO-like enzyme (type II secretory pathway)
MFLIYGLILHGWQQTLFGVLGGFLVMLVFYFAGLAFSKIVGKLRHREIGEVAFGFGDVTTSGILGLFTGWPVIIGAIILGFVAFTVYSVIFLLTLILTKKYKAFANALPFTPFLILGTIIIYYL